MNFTFHGVAKYIYCIQRPNTCMASASSGEAYFPSFQPSGTTVSVSLLCWSGGEFDSVFCSGLIFKVLAGNVFLSPVVWQLGMTFWICCWTFPGPSSRPPSSRTSPTNVGWIKSQNQTFLARLKSNFKILIWDRIRHPTRRQSFIFNPSRSSIQPGRRVWSSLHPSSPEAEFRLQPIHPIKILNKIKVKLNSK